MTRTDVQQSSILELGIDCLCIKKMAYSKWGQKGWTAHKVHQGLIICHNRGEKDAGH